MSKQKDDAPLRLGVVGTGSVVREIYQYLYFNSEYSKEIEVVAACDTNRQALEEFGNSCGLGAEHRFTDYARMIETVAMDAIAVNTPDNLHRDPVMAALDRGLDVVLPKPTAGTVADVHAMTRRARDAGRYLGVDFHKRLDPNVLEARARVRRGDYGTLQSATMYMLDRLMVSDPNHEPRFFSSPDFAEKNSPVTFLTSHMADTFMTITGLRPLAVQATGYKQKLPSLSPIAVDGYDLVDGTVEFEGGSRCHIVTGWAVPNTAAALTIQTARFLFSDGLLDLWKEWYGYHEITAGGIEDRNTLFRNFQESGQVTGYGITSPGEIIRQIRIHRSGSMTDSQLSDTYSPFSLGFYTTLVCECAHKSLDEGESSAKGVIRGAPVSCPDHLASAIGAAAAGMYY